MKSYFYSTICGYSISNAFSNFLMNYDGSDHYLQYMKYVHSQPPTWQRQIDTLIVEWHVLNSLSVTLYKHNDYKMIHCVLEIFTLCQQCLSHWKPLSVDYRLVHIIMKSMFSEQQLITMLAVDGISYNDQ